MSAKLQLSPQKKHKRYYSGFSKCHTLKSQLLVEFETGQIICTAFDSGKTHDFKLLKRSRLPFVPSQLCLADPGDQGFGRISCWGLYTNQEAAPTLITQG